MNEFRDYTIKLVKMVAYCCICTSLIEIRTSLQLFSYEWTCLTSKYKNLYLRPLIEVCTCRYANHIIVALHERTLHCICANLISNALAQKRKDFLLNHDRISIVVALWAHSSCGFLQLIQGSSPVKLIA